MIESCDCVVAYKVFAPPLNHDLLHISNVCTSIQVMAIHWHVYISRGMWTGGSQPTSVIAGTYVHCVVHHPVYNGTSYRGQLE